MALLLTPAEARVLAALVEKAVSTPQYYPMSVNALTLAANQKTCRAPVMQLSEGEVGAALSRLESEKLVSRDDQSSRVSKWRHRFQHQLLLKEPALAVLVTLMLRGPQTLSELKANAAGVNGPADFEGVQNQLQDLADRAQPLVALLPRAPGQKEARYAHLLCGVPDQASTTFEAEPIPVSAPSASMLEARLAALEARVAELERQLGL
jgi:uncharacterized protein YceH (UPF0502 family)